MYQAFDVCQSPEGAADAGLRSHRKDHRELSRSPPVTGQPFVVRADPLSAATVERAASRITSTTRFGSVYIGLWSTRPDRTFAPIRAAMNRCVFGLIMRSSSASTNQGGLVFHPGAGAGS